MVIGLVCVLLAGGLLDDANGQPKLEGEMRWVLYAIHDALLFPTIWQSLQARP